ncbi:MAG: hypothetical protein IJD92_03055 [Bacilli bacterium]|nr:hypothetical protein [Bacilli bacterium]
MNNTKKMLIVSIVVIVLVTCISLVSYGYVYTKSFGNSEVKNTTFISQTLKVLYSDGSESITSDYGNNFVPGSIINKTFTLTNIGNNDVSYSINISEVINSFTRKDDIVYEVSESGTVIGSGTFPSSDETLVLGDSLNQGQSKTYTLIISYLNTEDNQIVDSGATIGGKITFGERSNSLYKLNIYGNSKQDGTPSPTNPLEVLSLGTKTNNLFDLNILNNTLYEVNNDKVKILKSNTVGWAELESLNLKPNTKYILSVENAMDIDIRTNDYNVKLFKKDNTNTAVFTTDDTGVTCFKFFSPDDSYPFEIGYIQLNEGETATNYEPFGKYEIPISVESGKNLFDINSTKLALMNVHAENRAPKIENNIIYSGGKTGSSEGATLYINTLGNDSTTISFDADYNDSETTHYYRIYLFNDIDENGLIIDVNRGTIFSVSKENKNVVTVDTRGYKYVGIVFWSTNQYGMAISNLQFEKGDKATNYEPYKYSYVKSIYLDEPLRSVGTCDTCSDYIDLVNGKVVRNITKQYLKDFGYILQNVAVTGGYRAGYFSPTPSIISMKKGIALGGFSNVLPANDGAWGSLNSENIRFGQNNTVLYIYTTNTYATKADLLNYLGNGDSTVPYVVYQLNNPVYETIESIDSSDFVGKTVVVCDKEGICASRVDQI